MDEKWFTYLVRDVGVPSAFAFILLVGVQKSLARIHARLTEVVLLLQKALGLSEEEKKRIAVLAGANGGGDASPRGSAASIPALSGGTKESAS